MKENLDRDGHAEVLAVLADDDVVTFLQEFEHAPVLHLRVNAAALAALLENPEWLPSVKTVGSVTVQGLTVQ